MGISVIGISHHVAPIEVREAFALPGELARQLLRAFRAEHVFEEAMVLDTCNRTEVYFVSKKWKEALSYLLAHIGRIKGPVEITDTSVFYQHDEESAVRHLFRVAAALDSQIVGEHQILGQLKSAYRIACEERTAHFFLNKLLHWAFRMGNRSRSETDIGRGSTSVAQAAVDLSQHVFSSLSGKSAMLVGAGATGELAAKSLIRCGLSHVIVANRSIERARKVAEEILQIQPEEEAELDLNDTAATCLALGSSEGNAESQTNQDSSLRSVNLPATRVIGLEEIPKVIGEVDLIICATGSWEMVLTSEKLTSIINKSGRSLIIVDIAVPRDVDPALGQLPNVFLYNIDDLDHIVQRNIETRRLDIPRVEAIIADEFESFSQWFNSLQVTPTIKLLQQRFSLIRQAETKRYGTKFQHTDREQLEQFTQGLCNKILHQPIAFLRDLSGQATSSDRLAAVDMIRRIFRLDELEQDT